MSRWKKTRGRVLRSRVRVLRLLVLALLQLVLALLLGGGQAQAAGPRWVSGPPFYYITGYPVIWYTDTPQYFTDPGDLSTYVNHAAADAMVDAAAAIWNQPMTRLTISRGGVLDEDVSGANVYAGSTGVVFPADVQAGNYAARQIAVIYDADGAVTDTLLGAGASVPSGCRQNAVTESVDSFAANGRILHAVIVLNGRCTGPAAEQQLQMRYQLERAFGRVLGMGWSQTNDNVFTGSPAASYKQTLYWPIMHPIDVICGLYTFQCLPSPFTLRDDDLSGLAYLYPNPQGYSHAAGKVDSLATGSSVQGWVQFPSGQGMQGVNVVVHRREPFWDTPEAWESASSVSGFLFRRRNGNPVAGTVSGPTASMGVTNTGTEGFYNVYRVPLYSGEDWQDMIVSVQPVNPLYVGTYAVGPYDLGTVAPSGNAAPMTAYVMGPYGGFNQTNTVSDAAAGCDVSRDGTESAPAAMDGTGWQSTSLCVYGHAAWWQMTMRAGRTMTLEAAALDELGAATTAKMMPVLGAWNAATATGTLPDVASAAGAFNSTVAGMTRLAVSSGAQAQPLRLVVADQRGDGRPDYSYRLRVLYAETISPATLPAQGGTITIGGMGFRAGNTVTVNGVAAAVTGWTSNSITAVAPAMSAGVTASVVVKDATTGGSSTMTGVLSYVAPAPTLTLVSAPGGTVFRGQAAATPFAVQALAGDGVTPLAGLAVSLAATVGQVSLGVCGGGAGCTVMTDAQGRVSTTVIPVASGAVTLAAVSSAGTVTASFNVIDRVQTVTAAQQQLYVAAGAVVSWPVAVTLSDNGGSTAGVPVLWNAGGAGVSFFPSVSVSVSMSELAADGSGLAVSGAEVGPLPSGALVDSAACAWTTVCAGLRVKGVGPQEWATVAVSGGAQSLPVGTGFASVVLRAVDAAGNAVAGMPVTVYQTIEPWQTACTGLARCPAVAVYSSSVTQVVSGIDGSFRVQPLELAGQATVTRMAVTAGTGGLLTLVEEHR